MYVSFLVRESYAMLIKCSIISLLSSIIIFYSIDTKSSSARSSLSPYATKASILSPLSSSAGPKIYNKAF